MPKVSVLMPVYKTDENYLREAIESILSQTFEDFEFLILDDCPEDDREEIIKSYKDKRIKYYKNEKNLGITPSRNKLIDMAQGEYLAVFDHDDISLPERLGKQVVYLDEHPECGVVGCKTQRMSNGKQSKNPTNDHEIKLALMRTCALTHPCSMIRKSVLTENQIYYEEAFSPSEDYALWGRLIPHTKFHNLNDEVLFHYRDHAENTSHLQAKKMENATFAIWAFVKAENPALYEEFLLKARQVTKINICGIPFLTKIAQGKCSKTKLFGFIPLCSTKFVIKLQEKK